MNKIEDKSWPNHPTFQMKKKYQRSPCRCPQQIEGIATDHSWNPHRTLGGGLLDRRGEGRLTVEPPRAA